MADYRRSLLTRVVNGFVYLERTQMDGTVRQGLVGAVDLEAYSFDRDATPAIRPSENTVVERIPPRLRVRRGAELETPHVMLLADDEDCTLIEPIGREKACLPLLYDGELMLRGGHLTGWAVEDPALIAQDWATIRNTMWNYVGISRTASRLHRAFDDLRALSRHLHDFYKNTAISKPIVDLFHGCQAAYSITQSALRNPRSLGCHHRIN